MKLHLPKGLRKAVLACLAAVAAAGALSVTVGTANAAWGGAQKETAGGDGWGLVLEDHFSESSLNDDYWQRIQYETTESTGADWRKTQSKDESLAQFRDVDGNKALTLWGRYGKYTNQNNQTNATQDLLAAGGIYSKNVFSFQYGYVEVRARFDCVQGVWPAIWMMPAQGKTWPLSGEIDIMEHLNSDTKVYQTLHWDSNGGDVNDSGSQNVQPSLGDSATAATDWHTYGVKWTEVGITFYVDGNAAGTFSSTSEFWPFDDAGNEFYLIIDQQVGGTWVEGSGSKGVDQETLGSTGAAFDIDYVKVWSSDEYNHLQELTWQGDGDTWEEGTDVFVSGNSVVFGADGVKEVKIAGTVHAGNMSVRDAGYSFVGKDGGTVKLEVGGSLNMDADAGFGCAVELGGNVYCTLTGSGKITYTGTGEFTINTIDATGYSGTIEVTDSGRLLLSTNFETEGGTIDLGGKGILAFNNNNAAAGGADGSTTVTANLKGVTKLEGKGGFCVTLAGSVQGTGVLTTGKYNGAGYSSCFVFDGDVSGFSGFTTSAGQYNFTHYSGTSGHAAYTFNAGLTLSDTVTFNVVKNDDTAGHDTWIELSESSRLIGSGSIVKTGEGDLRVYGDTSGYSGTIHLQEGKLLLDGINGTNIDLSLENATAADNVVHLEGTGGVLKSVALGGTATSGSLALGDGAEWSIKGVNLPDGKTLTLRSTDGTADVQGLTGEGGTFGVQGGTVNLSGYDTYTGSISVSSGKLVLGSAPSNSGLTALNLNAGACVETGLTTGTLNFGALTVLDATRAAGDAVLSLTGVLESLKLEATSVEGTLHIELTDAFISSKVAGTQGYELFVDGESVWKDHVVFDNETYGPRLKLQGNLLVLEALTGLLWAGTEGSNTWSTASDNKDWKDSDDAAAFTDQSDVLFAEGDGVSKTVQLSGTLAPQNVTVQSGEGWVFTGSGSLAATGKITVGESGTVTLTLSGTGAVSSNGLVLVGEGSKLTITSAPSNGKFNFHHIELGEGTELVLQGENAADHTKWACENNSGMYASGKGSIVFEGTGVIESGLKDKQQVGQGILWAFFTNTEVDKPTIGNLKLRKHENTATTLVLNGEMGSDTENKVAHGIGVVENLWVEDGNTLMIRSRVLGETQTVRTLHLAGGGSNATYTGGAGHEGASVAIDAALVLGFNTSEAGQKGRENNIFWNITAEADTSISVLASAAGAAYTWKLEETVNTGTYTLTKKGAGTLVLDADSTLVGSGNVSVTGGLLQLAGGMNSYTGTMSLSGDAQAQFVGGQSLSLFTGTITLAADKTMAFDAAAQLIAGTLTASAAGLSFGAGTNFAAGSLTLTGTIDVTGGAALSGEGVLKVAESSTLSLDDNTYSGMKVELESGSAATDDTTSKLALNGGSFTGDVTTMGRGEITLSASTEGSITLSGDAYLTATNSAAFNGTITLTGSQQKFGIFDVTGKVLQRLIASKGDGVLVANGGSGGVIEAAEGLSEVWVGGGTGTQVSIGTLTAGGENHSFTTDNGVFKANFPNGEQAADPWAGNSGRVNVTGEVSGYTSFTARRKGSAVTDGIDLLFSGMVNMGDEQEITITAEHSRNENTVSYENAVILFDTSSEITGSGTLVKQGAGNLILAGTIAADAWAVNVNAGTLTLGKGGQDAALNYSFTGLTMAASTTTTVAGPCNLTLTGKLEAAQGTLALNAETTLALRHTADANQLGTLALGADGTLRLGMDAAGFASLALGTLSNTDSHQLTLQLEGLDAWVKAQDEASSYELQLFSGDAASDLVAAIGDSIEGLDGYTYEWDDTGKLTITYVPMIWSESGATMTWSSASNVWGDDHNAAFNGSQDVTFAGTSTAPITVTLGEAIDVQGNMTVQKGAGVSGSQGYTFATGDYSLTVGGNLSIADGLDVTFTGSGAVSVTDTLSVGTESGAASLTLSGTGAVSANGLVLAGDGSSLTITSAPSTGSHSFRRVELGAGTELVLQNAGTLTLDADSTLTGAGNVSVTGGLLQLAGGMNSYTGTMSLSGATAQVRFVGGEKLKLFTGSITLADVGTLAFDADAQLSAGTLTASATGLSFGEGTNFAAGSLTLTGTIAVTGGATLSGEGVFKVAESSTLSLDDNTYSGMKVELESTNTAGNDTTSKLALNGGGFTGDVTTKGRGEISLNANTAGAINVSGSAYLNVSGGAAFNGAITLTGSQQKFGIFGATGNQTVLQKLEATAGDGILVVSSAVGDTPPSASPELGGIVQEAVGLSEVWVGGPTGTHVTIGTLTAAGSNHSFTTDNGYFMNHFPDGAQGGNKWAGNSGRVDVTGDVSGYTSFTAKRKGKVVTDGIDLLFSGTVNMGDQQNITITAEHSQHENEASQDDATILFDTSSKITGSGTITKQGAGNLILAGTIAADAWAVNVNAGTLTLGKSGQNSALNYSFTGLSMAASTTTTVAGPCNLTLTGKLDAAQGTLALNADTTLALRHTAAANQLGTLALGADGTLRLGMDATGFASLELGALSNDASHQLTLQLEGLDAWIGAQDEASSYELQLFTGNAASALVAAIGDRIEGLGNYTYELDDNGLLTITVPDIDVTMTWSESGTAMTWSSSSNVWGENHNAAFDSSQDVTFAGTSAAPITVTLGEAISTDGSVTVRQGEGVSGNQSYTFATGNHALTVGGNLGVGGGIDVTFTGGGALTVGGSVTVGAGGEAASLKLSGGGAVTVGGKLVVGAEGGGAAMLTLSGSGAVTANGLTLAGEGSKLTVTATPGTGKYTLKQMEVGAGTELVLQGAAAANSAKWDCTGGSYASGAGSIVLEGTGVLGSGASHTGILWAFFTNTEEGKSTIGSFKLRKHGDEATTLVLNAEMGSDNANAAPVHGLGVIENLWVEGGNTLMVRSRALGETKTVRTLHLAGDGSNANFTGGAGHEGDSVTTDAALVLGYNTTADGVAERRSSIFWNITAEADTSISVLASEAGEGYTWKLEKQLNVGEHTVTKKGAGTLVLDTGSELVGSGELRVSAGVLQVDGNTASYTGTFHTAGGSLALNGVDASQAGVLLESGDVTLNGNGTLKDVRLGDTAASGTVRMGAAASWSLAGVTSAEGKTLTVQGTDGSTLALGGAEGFATVEGSALELSGVSCVVTGASDIAGELRLTGGTVLTAQGGGRIGTLKVDGGGLVVGAEQKLTVGTAAGEGRGLTELRLGAGAKLRVEGGALNATGTLSWGAGAEIELDGKERITLGNGFTLGGTDGTLQFRLSDDFMANFEESGKTAFFLGGLWDRGWAEMFSFTADSGYLYRNLRLNEVGCLAWDPVTGVQWTGGDDNTWTNGGNSEWEDVQGGGTVGGPQDVDVHFSKPAEETSHEVNVAEDVTPNNVYVESGDFTFTGSGGLDLTKGDGDSTGVLVVGGGVTDAKLTLDVANKNLPTVVLDEHGTLVLANDAALTKTSEGGATDTTLIKFKGGVLEYSGDKKLNDADVSGFVAQTESGSTDAVKVGVDASGAYSEGVTWGSTQKAIQGNGGLTLALDQRGIEKSGTGAFTLAWQETAGAATHNGAVKVDAGTLTLAVNTAGAASVLKGQAEVAEGGALVLRPTGGGGLTYAGNITGGGTLSVREGDVTVSGSNSVGHIELAGGTTHVVGDHALGGADTHLELRGGTLTSAGAAQVQAGSIEVGKETVVAGKLKLTGNLSGSGTLKAADGIAPEISGNMSYYEGKLDTGASGAWVLSGNALEGEIRAAVGGNGTVQFAGAATFGGEVADNVTLENTGGEELVVTSDTTSANAKLKGNITLGNAEKHAVWSGSALESGTITLSNVTLAAGDLAKGDRVRVVVDTAAAASARGASFYAARSGGSVVDVRGMNAEKLDGITVREGGQLTGLTGTYTVGSGTPLELYFAAENVSDVRDGGQALIVGGEGGLTLDVTDSDRLSIHLDAAVSAVMDVLAQGEVGEMMTAYLNLMDGGELRGFDDFLAKTDAFGILSHYVKEVSVDDAGNIVLKGSVQDVYVVPDEATTLTDSGTLNGVKATVMAQATDELTLSYNGATVKDGTVHNLLGVQGSRLHLRNTNGTPSAEGKRLEITFDNTEVGDINLADYPTVEEPEFGQTTVRGQHTTFDGSIDGGDGVDVTKAGLGTLSVGGNYTLTDGTTTITQGALKLRGQENSMNGLTFAYTTEERQTEAGEEKRGLLTDGGRTTVAGSITEAGVGKGDIALSHGAELVLQGASTLAGTSIVGDETGGTLTLTDGKDGRAGKLVLTGEAGATQLSGVGVNLQTENTELDLGKGKNDANFLSGAGTLKSAEGGTLGVLGGTFSGTLGVSEGATAAGQLVVLSGASFTLKNAASASGTNRRSAWDVQLAAGANFTVDLSEQPEDGSGSKLVLGDVILGYGNMTVNFGDRPIHGNSLEANIFGTGDDGTLTFRSDSMVDNGEDVKTGITVDSALRGEFPSHVQFAGAGNLMKDRVARVDEAGNLLVTTKDATNNKFLAAMPNAGKNGRAGAEMMWNSLRGMTQWDAFLNAMLNPTSDFEKLSYSLIAMYDNRDAAGLERTFTAVAGASVSVIAPALAEDMHRQLTAIRNRTTTMAGEIPDTPDALPSCHAWINAEGNYHKMDADGYLPGYTLDNWGGTLGFDADVTRHATVGLAITAMYGNLKPDSADSATGDLDTAYLSAFARLSRGAWIHTFVVSGGMADVKLDRTVNHGGDSYRAGGDTSGYAIGALYEVGYTKLVNESGSFALQPIANVEVRYASLRGYSEKGSDVGLNVGDTDQTVVTFGAGARMQVAVHANAFNRASVFEARMLVKADVGDRSGTARNAIIGNAASAETESAEVGVVGAEAGIGLSIPLGSRSGSVFVDGSVEFRDNWTSANATLGYRLNF